MPSQPRTSWIAALSAAGCLLAGCGQNPGHSQTTSPQTEELERLKAENQELTQARTDHEEVQRLKQANQELAKARSQYQEATRLKKENEQLRQQVAKISPAAAAALTNVPVPNAALAAPAPGAPAETEVAHVEGNIEEGDDIMVEPKYLKVLLPEFEWEKLGRKEPLGIKAVLERDGVQITNVAQLKEYGITNFIIQKAQPPPPPTQETR